MHLLERDLDETFAKMDALVEELGRDVLELKDKTGKSSTDVAYNCNQRTFPDDAEPEPGAIHQCFRATSGAECTDPRLETQDRALITILRIIRMQQSINLYWWVILGATWHRSMDAFSLELIAYLLGRLANFRKRDRWGPFVPSLPHLSNAQDGDQVTVRTHARVIIIPSLLLSIWITLVLGFKLWACASLPTCCSKALIACSMFRFNFIRECSSIAVLASLSFHETSSTCPLMARWQARWHLAHLSSFLSSCPCPHGRLFPTLRTTCPS
ncbi:unnamed protein product [Citrullus colocynthis]|uniref:Uncharacterized protein n=1 Tax=Citrullus colocynthis TaxID=252529 RepID=A0ABP0XWG1_9ROSI